MAPKFVARDRKQHKKSKIYDNHDNAETAPDSNALVVLPSSAVEKAQKDERRKEMKDELKKGMSKISSKKQKRMNKYIDSKLKKEERTDLIQKLAGERVDTSLFTSSTQIGVTKESKKNAIKRALLEEQAGINVKKNQDILYEERVAQDVEMGGDLSEDSDVDEIFKEDMEVGPSLAEQRSKEMGKFGSSLLQVGSGLKRPLEVAEDGRPIIKKVKRNPKYELFKLEDEPVVEEKGEELFGERGSSSEDDENDDEDGMEEYESWHGFSDAEDGGTTNGVDIATQNDRDELDEDDTDESEGSSSGEDDGDDDIESDPDKKMDDEDDKLDAATRLRRKGGKSDKASSFKAWAEAQRKEVEAASDVVKMINPTCTEEEPDKKSSIVVPHTFVPRLREESPPLPEHEITDSKRKAFYVTVDRSEEIQEQRLALPIVAEEQKIMEAIHNHNVVVLCGETGSGKTTQVPQFLFEAGYGNPKSDTPGMIGVTQPRRVAAVSMSKRVGAELGGMEDKVGYQIRFEGSVGKGTAIKFMTDGVLLREVAEDFILQKYSAVIIDEAHERSINTDILIGVMSRIVRLREDLAKEDKTIKPLKLIIMSATLRVSDFSENSRLFPLPPPILKAEARQFKVTNRFSLRTGHDYVEEAFKKVDRIHRRLPKGGILVFLTGQNEISVLAKQLKEEFARKPIYGKRDNKLFPRDKETPPVQILSRDATVESEDVELSTHDKVDFDEEAEDGFDDDEVSNMGEEEAEEDTTDELIILPLYSLLATKEQMRVFEPVKEGQRLCVLATNVAETSLTIPGIRYVVDTGRVKERTYDKVTGVQSFDIKWISKASAAQRAGRAGRTGPGQCYKLYSSAVYERDFEEFAEAEILRMPIEGVVLQMKSMEIHTVVNFPFPTAPDRQALQQAEKLLGYLGALDSTGKLTDLGRKMSLFPLSPRFAKTLVIGQQYECMPFIIALVSALSVGDLFVPETQLGFDIDSADDNNDTPLDNAQKILETRQAAKHKSYNEAQRGFAMLDLQSDALKLLTAVCAFEHEKSQALFCDHKFLRLKGMMETRKMRQQLTNIVRANFPDAIGQFDCKLNPPKNIQIRALKQIIAAGYIDQVAIRGDLAPNSTITKASITKRKPSDVPYFPLQPISAPVANEPLAQAVYIHPSSILASHHHNASNYPEYVVYSTLQRSINTTNQGTGKVRMKPLTTLTGTQLANLAKGGPLLGFSKPLEHPAPKTTVAVAEKTRKGGTRRECWVIPTFGGQMGKSELGWPLPPRRVVQFKEAGSSKWETDW